jgi:putative nucleotidyltransferase with HDIG domain
MLLRHSLGSSYSDPGAHTGGRMSRKLNPVVDVNKLPTLPAVALEAIRLMEGEDSNFSSVADLLRTDQVLASRILHYANSAYVGSRRRISSIPQAITLLGINAVRSIILSATIFDYFSEEFTLRRQSLLNFWLHSLGVGVTAEILARKLGFPAPEEAYLAGLLHDIGKLVCYTQSPEKFAKIWQEVEKQGSYGTNAMQPLEIEQQVLQTDHLQTGQLLAEQWGFPPSLTRAIWLHHQPIFDTILPEATELPKLIRFADVLCVTHNVGSSYMLPEHTYYSHEHFHFALENLLRLHNLTRVDIEAMMNDVYARVKEVGDILGIWDEDLYHRLIRTANSSLGSLSMSLEKKNRQLSEINRVLDATCEMTRRLRPGVSLLEAAGIIAEAACKAFMVERSLCLIRDEGERQYTGQLLASGALQDLRIGITEGEKGEGVARADIETEAIDLLARANLDPDSIGRSASGMINVMAGAKFLAAFFVSDNGSHLHAEPILGELVVDFADSHEISGAGFALLQRNFESLALAASSAIERLLLETDLTQQTREMAETTRKMEESQRQLFHSHRLATVGRLAAGAAHEINNPLTIISLNLQLMERLLDQQDTAALKERLRVVAGQEERIAKIIHDLMSFARPTQPKFASSSVAGIVARVLSVLGDRISLTHTQIKNNLAAELPAVMVDPLQIEQVFMNLFINANQAMPKGGEITIEGAPAGNHLEIRVSDTGKGIEPKDLNKIFDPFFTTKKEGEGTGLGLAICHSIVEHNGGFLRVQSLVDRGTTFLVNLPLDRGSRLRAMKEGLEQETAERAVAAGPEKIPVLVADDERILNDMLQESLRGAGYAVDGVYDGLEAIRQLREKPYRLLILDIRMPNKDGLEVLEFVKNEYPDVQVVIITALASKEEIKETVRRGAYACLRKPFRFEKVLDTVSRALENKGADIPAGK